MRQRRLAFLALLLSLAVASVSVVLAQTVITSNQTGTHDGYDYEFWKDEGGSGRMTLKSGGTFSCEWNNVNNILFRKGRKLGASQTHQQLGNISMTYDVIYNPAGNSYLCVYGWTKNPLVEYYIVESWGNWRPPGASSMGTITVDGGSYDVYRTTRVNQPSIEGTSTFDQYWSVRTSKRTSGTISISQHFNAWESRGLQMGMIYEVALCVEGYQSSGNAAHSYSKCLPSAEARSHRSHRNLRNLRNLHNNLRSNRLQEAGVFPYPSLKALGAAEPR